MTDTRRGAPPPNGTGWVDCDPMDPHVWWLDPASLRHLRAHRMLRLIPEPACDGARRFRRTPHDPGVG